MLQMSKTFLADKGNIEEIVFKVLTTYYYVQVFLSKFWSNRRAGTQL